MTTTHLKHLALLMAANCVRNTVIENYHAQGKLDDDEMKAFNQEVANKIFTFLNFLMKKPADDHRAFMSVMELMYPTNWDQPELDTSFMAEFRMMKKRGGSL